MKCNNCGEEVNENTRYCPKCGERILKKTEFRPDNEDESETNTQNAVDAPISSNNVETTEKCEENTGKKSNISYFLGLGILVLVVFFIPNIRERVSEDKFYKKVYSFAVDELKNEYQYANNLKVADYKHDNVKLQTWEYHDFGDGNLRYARIAVTIPCEYDTILGHVKNDPTMTVYYYSSDQNITDGVDPNVPDYLYTPGLYLDAFDGIY